MDALDELNRAPEAQAADQLTRCCGSSAWVRGMLAERPFRDRAQLFAAASRVWRGLQRSDWEEAFSHHPRIGQAPAKSSSTAGWAVKEQAGAAAADERIKAALAEGNREYEARFGHIYLVCATGRSGAELLALLQQRMKNEPAAEFQVAVGEQETITAIRLERLLSP